MTHPGRQIGEILHRLGYVILGGDTIFPSAENLDIIGVLERVDRKRGVMDGPDTFYGRRIALIRVRSAPIIIEYFRVADISAVSSIKMKIGDAGFRTSVILIEKTEKQIEMRFK